MRTCQKAIPAIGGAHETMEAVADVMEAAAEVAAVSAVNVATEAAVVVAVFVERGPVARREVTAEHPTDLLALAAAPVIAATTAEVLLVGTGVAAEIVVGSGDAMTATADRVSRLHQSWPG